MRRVTSLLLLSISTLSQAHFAADTTIQNSKDTVWTLEGKSSLNFTQGFLENWTPGGENFLSTLILNDYTIDYEKKRASWENNFTYKLGGTQQGEQDVRKTEDIFEFNSKFGYNLKRRGLFFSNIVNFKSQAFKGFDYTNEDNSKAISRFLNPGYLIVATGFEYKYKKIMNAMVSPLSGKLSFMTDTVNYDPTAFGIEEGEKLRGEMGAYARINFKKEIVKNIVVNTYLELFNNYFNNPENIDINWQTTISFNVNKYIKAVLFTHVVYDDDVPIPKANGKFTRNFQIKETLGIGIAYTIGK